MDNSEKVVSLNSARDKAERAKEPQKPEGEAFEPVYCSFCGRPNAVVPKMVQGPGVNICSECTMIAVQYLILEDKLPSSEAQKILDMFWGRIK